MIFLRMKKLFATEYKCLEIIIVRNKIFFYDKTIKFCDKRIK